MKRRQEQLNLLKFYLRLLVVAGWTSRCLKAYTPTLSTTSSSWAFVVSYCEWLRA